MLPKVIALIALVLTVCPALAQPSRGSLRPHLRAGQTNWVNFTAESGLIVQSLADGLTPVDVVAVLTDGTVNVANIQYSGAPLALGSFSGGEGIIGFDSGILLSSGSVKSTVGPNLLDNVTTNNGRAGDADLDALNPGAATFDAAVLEFDFTCDNPLVVQFQFVFASDEYNEFVGSSFNDVFAFFVNGANIALLPDGVTPVAVNTVNCGDPFNPPNGGVNCDLFVNNDLSDGGGGINTEMDGLTRVFLATTPVNPGVNKIKIAIADVSDFAIDSAVFLRAESFKCALPRGACCNTLTLTCTDDVLQEDCAGAGDVWTFGATCAELTPPCATPPPPPAAVSRASASEKGSLLIFPYVEVRYNAAGDVVQDTFLEVSNDYNSGGVHLLTYFVSDDCAKLYSDRDLTKNQPVYWSAATGQPFGLAPIFAVPGGKKLDPQTGEWVVRGHFFCFATDDGGQPIRWNHLTGEATVVRYTDHVAWTYSPYAFRALTGVHGDPVGTAGELKLDGEHYDLSFNRLLMEFFTVGSSAMSGGGKIITHDTQLTLMINDLDVRQEKVDFYTKALFQIWNEDEASFATEYCMPCWYSTSLSDLGVAFSLPVLGFDRARAGIDGIASPLVCDQPLQIVTGEHALLGVATKILAYNNGKVALAGGSLPGTGTQAAVIRYDVPPPPEEIGQTP